MRPSSTQSVAEMRTDIGLSLGPRGAHGAEHLERKAQTILQRAAVLVGPLVAHRREEAREQVAVRAVQLDHVEAGVDRPSRRAHELVAHVVHVGARHLARRADLLGVRQSADGPIVSQPPSSSGMSVPSHGSTVEPFAAGVAELQADLRRRPFVHELDDAPPVAACSGAYIPVQPSVIRASGDTQVISVITSPAPPSARAPRWTRWKSFGVPSVAEYMSIGETTTRFASVSSRSRNGVNIGGGAELVAACPRASRGSRTSVRRRRRTSRRAAEGSRGSRAGCA